MIKTADGYSIVEFPSMNKLVIVLPQHHSTANSTALPTTSNRKRELSQTELSMILQVAKDIYSGRYDLTEEN